MYTHGEPNDAERAAVHDLFDDPVPPILAEKLPDTDWVSESQKGVDPIRAGRFRVRTPDHAALDDPSLTEFVIPAAQAFGTGQHETTAGCLETIERVARRERPRNALDLGAGSAVLAIGIAKLARIPVLATDIDPVAVEVARENIRANGVASFADAVTATGFSHRAIAARAPYDLIVANILARPLMSLAPEMARQLAPGGSLILSGILTRQRRAVLAAYAGQRFRHVRTLVKGEWVTIHLKRG